MCYTHIQVITEVTLWPCGLFTGGLSPKANVKSL